MGSKFAICLLCHAERAHNSSIAREEEFTQWVPEFIALLDQIERDTGVHIPVTWCCCTNHQKEYIEAGTVLTAQEYPDIWRRIVDRGDEVGLHIHLKPEVGERPFEIYAHEFQHLFLEEDVSRMVDFGFAAPKTYTPGNQVWRREWAGALLKAGFEVDSTIMALPSDYLVWPGCVEHVLHGSMTPYTLWRHRPQAYPFRPYRTQENDLCEPGHSALVELPVIGWIGSNVDPAWNGFTNSPPFDFLVEIKDLAPGPSTWIAQRALQFEIDHGLPFPSLHQRWKTRGETAMDIWPTLFHPRELVPNARARIDHFIRTLLEWEDVVFLTAYDAARAWKQANPKGA